MPATPPCCVGVQGPNAEARRQVEALKVVTDKYGEQRLDAEPDRRMVGATNVAFMHGLLTGS